jgi:succinoglycan biosynthesis protein ExoA
VPCYNEQETILLLLNAIYTQTIPHSDLEVIIADGLSTDQTRSRIAEFQQQHPDLKIIIVDNPLRAIPSALNRALEAARGKTIIRMDAHSVPAPNYIERCLADLEAGNGTSVGGIWKIMASRETWIARAIAVAAAHPLGVGDAFYRLGGTARSVDTVPFGAFQRDLVNQIGFFDESLLTNEDYEFNTRIRQAGGVIWLDPQINSTYFTRPDLIALARQYARYGFWKAQMLRRYPGTLRWRQTLPPLFVLSVVILLLLAPWFELVRWLLLFQIALYCLVLLLAGLHIGIKKRHPSLIIGLPLAIATMHLSWGAAFMWGVIFPPSKSYGKGKH